MTAPYWLVYVRTEAEKEPWVWGGDYERQSGPRALERVRELEAEYPTYQWELRPHPDWWVVGVLVEFADGGPSERALIRSGPEADVHRTAERLEQIGMLPPYTGPRPVSHAVVFVCRGSQVDEPLAEAK